MFSSDYLGLGARWAPPSDPWWLGWEGDDERRAVAHTALDCDLPAMGFDDFFRNRQA
jgi:hypothetical protein